MLNLSRFQSEKIIIDHSIELEVTTVNSDRQTVDLTVRSETPFTAQSDALDLTAEEYSSLIVTLGVKDQFSIDNHITVKVLRVDRNRGKVTLGFDAPESIDINREEVELRGRDE